MELSQEEWDRRQREGLWKQLPPYRAPDRGYKGPDHVGRVLDTIQNGDDDHDWASLIIDGKTWLTSGPDHPDPLWGTDKVMLAAKNQPTTIAGPQGAGKTVFGQRIALGWIGLIETLLGLPVATGDRNVLYLACDRPDQARLSMRRMVDDDKLDHLKTRCRVWQGPPPEDVAKQPLMLLRLAEAADADLIVIDSAKDIALKLSADEIGAAYNSALQHCATAGVQVLVLHHPRKLSGDVRDQPVRTLDDLYGSYWVTAGNGSVIYLQPGDFDTYTLTQLKSPIGEKAQIPYEHVVSSGDVQPPSGPDLAGILEKAGTDGITSTHIARCLLKVEAPNESQLRAVRRALNELAEEGTAEPVPGAKTKGKRWRLSG
jgi:replicative DNA helicase